MSSAEDAHQVEEAGLLALTGQGDRAAFRLLYARYRTPLFSLALRLVGDAGAAEEILQDAFLKIWRHAATYDSRLSRPFTWAVTILRRTGIDHLRQRHRLPVTTPLPASGVITDLAPELDGRQVTEAHEDSARLRGVLQELPELQRQALELALFSGLTHFEIAEQLRQPVGTIKSWIRRGLLDLRTTLIDQSP